ncbi:MAG: Dam family site-specific DNA-(adenine-N6)-methyltransferase [Chitinophagaceae bacterium]
MKIIPEISKAKPFLKWAGGKSQLLTAIQTALPGDLYDNEELVYVEPFIGSGAVLFWFLQQFPKAKKAVVNDMNPDLFKAFAVVKKSPRKLVKALLAIEKAYYQLKTLHEQSDFYYEKRERFNTRAIDAVENTALIIFLNKTCFNGLFRVNSKNEFNVPFGKNHNPRICDPEIIMGDSLLLQKVKILEGDYAKTLRYTGPDTFFYLDPPYKPISKTSSFNSYVNDAFDDEEQVRLKKFCTKITSKGGRWLLSNSDPKNTNPDDLFFDRLFSGQDIYVDRVRAKRNINSVVSGRGEIDELLISNYAKIIPADFNSSVPE